MTREYRDYLEDIVGSIAKVEQFVEGMTYDEFTKDDKTIFAVLRALEIIGEAVKKIKTSLKDKYASVPQREMAGMRDKLIHEYFGVNLKVVWDTVKTEIPVLKPLFHKMLEELSDE